jgi:hypothetical protein
VHPEWRYVDRIDQIVEHAITYTLSVLRAAPSHIDAARAGLERLRNDLTHDVPDHPALERLRFFLDGLELRETQSLLH